MRTFIGFSEIGRATLLLYPTSAQSELAPAALGWLELPPHSSCSAGEPLQSHGAGPKPVSLIDALARSILALAGAAGLAGLLAAQGARAVAPGSGSPSDPLGGAIVELSPFEVRSTVDTGYVGQDTLAGSRLRTNLKDIAAAISPMTAEFLSDIAATDVNSAMEYGLSTRVDTEDGSAGAVGSSYTAMGGGPRSIRIRGLPGGGRSLNFFGAPGEVDLYMTDQIQVSRGPNSILYGLGSPAGIVNVSSKQAQTDKSSYSVSSRIDSWNGQRWTADANVALLKNKIGVRAVLLRGREESWRAAGYNDQDRLFLAAKWQIDRKTTLKAEFEQGEIKRFTPRPYFGLDMTSTWNVSGQPLFNNFAANYVPGTPGTGATGTPGTPIRDVGATNVVGVVEIGADYVVVSDRFPYAQNFRQFTKADYPNPTAVPAPDFVMGRRNPEAVLEANWVSLASHVNNASVFFQRELARNLNLEVAFNRQTSRHFAHQIAWNFNGVSADTNLYLPNGTLKPRENLYHVDVQPTSGPTNSQVKQGRVTLSYEKSIPRLGTLRIAGLGETAATESRAQAFQQFWMKGPAITSGGAFNPTPENAVNKVVHRFYINSINDLNDPNFRIPGPYDLSVPTKYQDPRTGAVSNIYMRELPLSGVNINYTDRKTGATMGVVQAFLLQDRLVTTYGYRTDRLKSRVAAAIRDPAAEAIAPNTGVWTPVDPSTATPSIFNGLTRTVGGVLHLTSWLSGFYNQSNNRGIPNAFFRTPSDPRQTSGADQMPQPSGKTKDYGLKLSLLKNRVFITATQFHTVSKNEAAANGTRAAVSNIWLALANSTALNAEETENARRQSEVITQATQLLKDSESSGQEFEILGRPLPGWSLSANYSRSQSTQSNIGREYRAYLDYWKPYWLKYRNLSLTQNTTQPRPQYSPSFQDWNTPVVIAATGDITANTDSINESIADIEQAFFGAAPSLEGRRFVGEPRHSINLRTRFDFREGLITGLSLGLGVRIRQGRVAGSRSEFHYPDGAQYTDAVNGRVIDQTSSVYAADQNVYDAQLGYTCAILRKRARWSIQLNVNNLTNQRELVVNNTDPITLAPVQYRYQDPRQFILTNTFSF